MGSIAESQESKAKLPEEEHFFRTRNIVVEVYLSSIGPTAFAVYSVILRHAYSPSSSYPGRRRIAHRVGVSMDAVDDALKVLTGDDGRLAECGLKPLIRKEYRWEDVGDLTTNRYHVLSDITTVRPDGLPLRRKRRSDSGTKRPKSGAS